MQKVKNSIFHRSFIIFSIFFLISSFFFYTRQTFATETRKQSKTQSNPSIISLSDQLFSNLKITAKLELPKGRGDEFSENDIVFYNPDGTKKCDNNSISSYNGKVNMSGSNAFEKAWSAFRSIGYTKEQTAGILGNLVHESASMNPVTHEGSQKSKWWKNSGAEQVDGHFDLSKNPNIPYGLGIIQFSKGWRIEMYNYIVGKDPSLAKYLNEPEKYSPNYSYGGDSFIKDAGEDVFDKLFAIQVEYLHDPNSNSFFSRIKLAQAATTIEDMAAVWSAKVEICTTCGPGGSEYNERIKSAKDIYQKYSHESFMTSGKSVTTSTNSSGTSSNASPTSGNHGELLSKHSSVTFYGAGASENGGYTGKNASGKINGGKLADGQVAKHTKDPDLELGDVIYIETTPDTTKEGSYAHGKYFIVADTGAGIRSGNYNIDVFHDVQKPSDNNPAPYGSSLSAKIYRVAKNVSWENYLNKYKNKSGGQSDGSDVTIIGDQLTVTSKNEIIKLLPKARVLADSEKKFATTEKVDSGIETLKKEASSNSLRQITVIALGTNDKDGLTSEQINEAINIVGNNRKIIFVTNYSKDKTENDNFDLKNNNQFKTATANNKNVTIADWSKVINTKTDLLENNYMPKTPSGSELFAKTIQEAVNSVSSSGGSTSNPDCTGSYVGNATIVDGYAFPIIGTTKANLLQPGNRNGAGQSELSPLPCKSRSKGACHHDYYAFDLGVRKKMIDGHEYTAKDFPDIRKKYEDWYYYSTGAKVAAITDGYFTYYKHYSEAEDGYQSKCASVGFKSNDGKTFWYGHMKFDPNRKGGDKFKAGEVVGEIGPPSCAIGTQAHLHIQRGTSRSDNYVEINDILNKLWESVPEQ